jgi:hypothetical protein
VLVVHPDAGLHIHVVIPTAWGPFVDVRACYEIAARSRPWLSVLDSSEFLQQGAGDLSADDQADERLYVVWDPSLRVFPKQASTRRRALVALVYSEALGNPAHMLGAHREQLQNFHARVGDLDAVLLHTPWMQTQFAPHAPAFALPVGWEPEAMGQPRWHAPKHRAYVYHGSMAGKRQFTVPYLTRELGDKFYNASGSFGRGLIGLLDTAQAALYLGHSDVSSWSTWRIWQVIATSTALVAEPGDCWPLEPGRHFVQLPRIDYTNIAAVVRDLKQLAAGNTLAACARTLYDDLAGDYTTGKIVDQYLVPAAKKLRELREETQSNG